MCDRSILPIGQVKGDGVFHILIYLCGNQFNDFAGNAFATQFISDHSFGEFLSALARLTPGASKFLIIDVALLLQTKENGVGNILCNATTFEVGEELAPTLGSRCERD